jgi:hypothetical protein
MNKSETEGPEMLQVMNMLETQYSELKESQSKEFMDASIARRLDILERDISGINSELENRNLLHSSLGQELDQEIKFRESELKRFGGWKYGSVFEDRVNALEKEINDSRKEMRFEELNFWRDVSRLREGLRKVLVEYWQLQKKKEFLGKYLNTLNNNEW